jgi:hypothetical protein
MIRGANLRRRANARTIANAVCLALLCVIATAAAGSVSRAGQATLDRYVELIRSDIKTQKTAVLTEALALNDTESKAFWPIYREYDAELSKWGDTRYELIKQYAWVYNDKMVTDTVADDLATRMLKLIKDRADLWAKYYKKFAKSVSPMRAAQFVQAENQINMLIDLQIASEVPFISKSK